MKAQQNRPHYLSRIEPKPAVRATTTPEGRYIPHSGGIMGWFENSGVLKREQGNNYRFHTALDVEAVRSKLFARWNDGEDVNRRAATRHEVQRPVSAQVTWPGGTAAAQLMDYSSNGLRMQVLEDELALGKGDAVTVRILAGDAPEAETAFELAGTVMWLARGGQRRTVWSVGLMFEPLPEEQAGALKALLG